MAQQRIEQEGDAGENSPYQPDPHAEPDAALLGNVNYNLNGCKFGFEGVLSKSTADRLSALSQALTELKDEREELYCKIDMFEAELEARNKVLSEDSRIRKEQLAKKIQSSAHLC